MKDTLEEICAAKRQWVAARKTIHPLEDLKARARDLPAPRGFRAALIAKHASGGTALIAEIKKASPSKGLIRADFHPADLAHAYQTGGAAALSVLTDVPYFQGEDGYIGMARGASSLPILRKDFLLEPYQVYEARALGADCILLIMACLSESRAQDLQGLAHDLGLDVLIEVHDAQEMARATALTPDLLGINNRNLKTLDIDLATFESLAPQAPAQALLVAESGLYQRGDVRRMATAGARAYLIGESLMRQSDVAAATRALLRP